MSLPPLPVRRMGAIFPAPLSGELAYVALQWFCYQEDSLCTQDVNTDLFVWKEREKSPLTGSVLILSPVASIVQLSAIPTTLSAQFFLCFCSCMHTQTPNTLILLGHPGSSSDTTAALHDLDMLWCSLSWEAASVFFNALTSSSSLNCFFHLGPWL